MSRFKAPTTPEVSQREILNQQRVRDLAVECMVVLKNDGTLPLKTKGKKRGYIEGVEVEDKRASDLDLSGLSDEEIATVMALLKKAKKK